MNNKVIETLSHIFKILFSDEKISRLMLGGSAQDLVNDKKVVIRLIGIFLIGLTGKEAGRQAMKILDEIKWDDSYSPVVDFIRGGWRRIDEEIEKQDSSDFIRLVTESADKLNAGRQPDSLKDIAEILWPLFFPEGMALMDANNYSGEIRRLRKKRAVKIIKPSPDSRRIKNPARQLLMTSNLLLTIPLKEDIPGISGRFIKEVKSILKERQKYWYDHPIPLGINPEANEALYGLNGLNDMIEYEKSRKTIPENSKLNCVLSASTTHDGLHQIVRPWINEELKKNGPLKNLDIYILTEEDTTRIIREIFIPLANHFNMDADSQPLRQVFGVDGEYSRHYSFLKAISAFWNVFINPAIEATFKIDLDQIFPQEALLEATGKTAMELLCDHHWGAAGIDDDGNKIELGMIAGALVNHDDIGKGLFTADVPFPDVNDLKAEDTIFFSRLPQALSTEAEMMYVYDHRDKTVAQRIHVTGGTNGILVDALFKYRPFTPTFIGRAEDQAYILSVLFSENTALRYLHKPGLIMRHDKHVFAGKAIREAQTGKWIGDYVRTLLFSYYARILPWKYENIKSATRPFTGCFISDLPVTVVYLRWAFKTLELINKGQEAEAHEFMTSGAQRLDQLMTKLEQLPQSLKETFETEKAGWDMYYDLLILSRREINEGDSFLLEIRQKAGSIITACKLNSVE